MRLKWGRGDSWMQAALVSLQCPILIGFTFIFAAINTVMVPNDANIVDIHLVLPQMTTVDL